VWEAWERVKANKGAPGVDGCSVEEFEAGLRDNLFKIWNRMSSGSYFPPPVLAVEIPKSHGGGTRILGVPTVADRVAQTVVARRVERKVEPMFHPDSYGYRPGRSALDAVATCRRRCWKTDWVIDLDIQKFFDSVRWDLMVKAVEANTDQPWVVLYVKRWLAAPLQQTDGTLLSGNVVLHKGPRSRPCWRICSCTTHSMHGWPGSSRPSPSNAMSMTRWCTASARAKPTLWWRRSPTGWSRSGCGCTLTKPGLSTARTGNDGARTRARRSRSWGSRSGSAGCGTGTEECLARFWRLHRRTGYTFADLARRINPIVRGWMQYYGAFYRSALYPLLARINAYLVRWIRRKYKRLQGKRKAHECRRGITARYPRLFAHWAWVPWAPRIW
jgi:RNA-directed DNA polymerase